MKKILLGLSIFVGVIFILWIALIFPYPPCTTKQIEVMKYELIEGILQREIKLRELYAKENGKEFKQTEEFKQQLQKEKEKFYMYCNNDGASEYKNEHCEVTRSMDLLFFERYTSYTLKYHFDEESKVFFNEIVTFWDYKRTSTDKLERQNWLDAFLGIKIKSKKVWHDNFFIPFENEYLLLLYPANIVGYYSEYNYFSCSDSADSHYRGIRKFTLASGKPVTKEDLVLIESKSIVIRHIKTYIQRKKK